MSGEDLDDLRSPSGRHHYWILDGHEPVPAKGIEEWGKFFADTENRRVAWTQIDTNESVSTVFLGLDHNWSAKGPPILFETMVFGGSWDQYQDRYVTWDEAEHGHQEVVSAIMDGKRPPFDSYDNDEEDDDYYEE